MIKVAYRGHVAVLTMQHGKANALDVEFCNEIIHRFEQLEASPARAIVLTGQGRIFSAGVDLIRAVAGGSDYLRDFLPVLSKAFAAIFFYPKPVVAAINGHAIAGGCVLACAADRRLMAREAGRIGVTELLVGVPFPPIAFEIMRFAAAPASLAEIIFTGATYAPEAAINRGLVDEIVEPEVVIDRAVAAAETLAGLAPATFALTKRQCRLPVEERLQHQGVDAAVEEIWLAPETVAKMGDYVARTLKKN